jgi:hypothetical protein
MTMYASTPARSVASTGTTDFTSGLTDEMPDPDNLRVDTTSLPVLPAELRSAPSIGERLSAPRHRAEYTRSA